jgi:hypothetical protein
MKFMKAFRRNLEAAAKTLNARVVPWPKMGEGHFRVALVGSPAISLNLMFNLWSDRDPYIQFGTESKRITNLSRANLVKHLNKRFAARKENEKAMALENAIDNASALAEKVLAGKITRFLGSFLRTTSDMDTPLWKCERGWFKLAYIDVAGSDPANFELTYNVEFDFKTGTTRDLHIKGEIDAKTTTELFRAMQAVLYL